MQNLSWYLHRLKSMRCREVLWRIQAALSNYFDLIRIPLRWYPKIVDTDSLRRDSFTPGYKCSSYSSKVISNSFASRHPSWNNRLIRKAESILQNRLTYFNLEEQFLGQSIDWQKDFSSGRSGRPRLSSLIDYRDVSRVGDCKLVWEPNRHHQLVILARAFKVTGESKYAEKAVGLMLNWIKDNPFGYGMNWRSPLEESIRLINWVWTIDLLRDASAFDDVTWKTILETIYISLWDIQRKYSQGSSANNHLIGEAAGVFVATSYFPSMPNATIWRAKSKQILEEQVLAQSYSDGCTREHAFGYQIFVIEFFSLCALAAESSDNTFSDTFLRRLHAMYNFLANICSDTGEPPDVGDSDDGYVLDLGELPRQAAGLISVGAHLFDDDRLLLSSDAETVYWLFGDSNAEHPHSAVSINSKAFPESGYFMLRSDPEHDSTDRRLSVLFDCAELGFGAIAAHGHADCLSITLNIGVLNFLIDSGTYDYFSYPQWRSYFRSSRAHNTVTVDGQCQSESLGPFMWGKRATASLLKWEDDESQTVVSGEHDGYARLHNPVIHQRTVALDKKRNSVEITDHLITKGYHRIRRYFHLAAECSVKQLSDTSVRINRSGVYLDILTTSGTLSIETTETNNELGWVSRGYHSRESSRCLVISNEIQGLTELVTILEVTGEFA